ncbi:PREDICTED: uncharacterized protein LOC108975665 [Bactrocera latifrons]|uniref:Uncharacterized protein n=1 Tax=Bactrocera latifrons TaxID=174628 RepID=A0A0K8W678_BACLA|nr:PREDICTED: uncharacterized protein LOC108975665 [Bactrocera latifrons]XP_018799894.1 PREDICTED: uncharacterized protein LOC108975665 [Bactrocera latifrons]
MGRKSKARAKGKQIASARERQIAQRSRLLMQGHVTELVIRHHSHDLNSEGPSTSRTIRKPKPTGMGFFYLDLKGAFADAFYSDNTVNVPKLGNIFKAENFEANVEPIPKIGNNTKTDIEETLIILKVCQLRAQIVKIEEEKKIRLAGNAVSPHTRAKLSKLDYVQEGIRRDIRTMRAQLRSMRQTGLEQLSGSEKNSDCFVIVDEHGENISEEGAAVKFREPNKMHELIKREFRAAFYENMAAHLEGVYPWQGVGAKMVNCSSSQRVVEDHADILARAIKVIESRILDCDNGKAVNLKDEKENYYPQLDGLYPTSSTRCENIEDLDESFFLDSPTSLRDSCIIINSDGEKMCKQEFEKFFTRES